MALEEGRISLAHARVVLEQVELCDPGTARAVDVELWSRPPWDRTPAQLRDLVRRIVTRLDPDLLRRRPEHPREQRELRYWSDDHGATGVLQLRLPADEARGVYAVIDAVARGAGDPAEGPRRDLGQKRADSARDLVLDGATARRDDAGCCSCATHGDPHGSEPDPEASDDHAESGAGEDGDAGEPDEASPTRDPVRGLQTGVRTPVRTEVRVTIGWDVLAGFSDRPGELEGHGPIPAPLARRLAADPDAWWRRLFTDPVTGTAAHLDAKRYRPPGSMREFVRARDVTCAAPRCRVPAARCDLDHVVPYAHREPGGGAGATRAGGLKPAAEGTTG
ncbi:MAG TPA: DUF222 domain-containing protein [Actinomycetospora sp.]|nr:DUF222 domain-containing protein [Actinomycetospora sp.]